MTSSSAPIAFASPEWCAAFEEAINANPGYRAAAKDWTARPVAMVVTAEPAIGIAEDMAMWLDVHQGECRGCRLVSRAEAETAPFVSSRPRAMEGSHPQGARSHQGDDAEQAEAHQGSHAHDGEVRQRPTKSSSSRPPRCRRSSSTASDVKQNLTNARKFFDHRHRECERGASDGAGRR